MTTEIRWDGPATRGVIASFNPGRDLPRKFFLVLGLGYTHEGFDVELELDAVVEDGWWTVTIPHDAPPMRLTRAYLAWRATGRIVLSDDVPTVLG